MAKSFGMTIEFDGIEKYLSKIGAIETARTGVIKAAVYDGAAVAVEAIKQSIRENTSADATGDLENSLGLSKMEEQDGYIYTKVGYEGYDRNGHPNVLKARVLENGTSDGSHKPTRFTSKAIKKCRRAVETQMEVTANDRIQKIMK